MPGPALEFPDEWRPGLDALRGLPDGAAALLVGATDRGKTTFLTLAARELASEFGRVALVDADIGQGEIGPPGTVGLAWAREDAAKLADLSPAGVFFVGAFAPNAAALELVVAAGQAVRAARDGGARRILVDTTGFVAGPAARRLKVAKAQAVAPALLLSFGPEVGPLTETLSAATGAPAASLAVSPAVGRKSQSVRGTRRLTRLSRALEKSRELALPLSVVATVGATLGTGEPVPPHLVRWAGTALRLPAAYAEQGDGTLTLYLRGPVPRAGWEEGAGPVAAHFGARTVRALSLALYADTYVGLHDVAGRLLSIGRFTGLDAERGALLVSAPPPAAEDRVRLVAFGRVRLNADGGFHSDIKPGEL